MIDYSCIFSILPIEQNTILLDIRSKLKIGYCWNFKFYFEYKCLLNKSLLATTVAFALCACARFTNYSRLPP